MDLSAVRKKILVLQEQREKLELKCIRTRTNMEAGSLITEYTSCRKGNCKCTRGEKHGPFIYLSQKIDGKMKKRYAGKESDKPTVKKVKAYMQYQDRLAALRKTNKEIDGLLNQYRELLIIQGEEK